MRRELTDLLGSGLLLAALIVATIAVLAPTSGASAAPAQAKVIAGDPQLERGRSLFYQKGCAGCHVKAGEQNVVSVGPALTGLASRADQRKPEMSAEAYVRESIKTPSAFLITGYAAEMPDLGLSDDEIAAVSAFLLGTP